MTLSGLHTATTATTTAVRAHTWKVVLQGAYHLTSLQEASLQQQKIIHMQCKLMPDTAVFQLVAWSLLLHHSVHPAVSDGFSAECQAWVAAAAVKQACMHACHA